MHIQPLSMSILVLAIGACGCGASSVSAPSAPRIQLAALLPSIRGRLDKLRPGMSRPDVEAVLEIEEPGGATGCLHHITFSYNAFASILDPSKGELSLSFCKDEGSEWGFVHASLVGADGRSKEWWPHE